MKRGFDRGNNIGGRNRGRCGVRGFVEGMVGEFPEEV